MKAAALAAAPEFSLIFLTRRPDDARRVREALLHAYPGAEVDVARDTRALEGVEEGLALIDCAALTESQLDHLLDGAPEMMALLVVESLADVRRLTRHLTGRRAVVAREDLAGVGLVGAIHHLIERNRLHEQLKSAARHLKELSIRDDLTRLYNHRHFDEILSAEVRKASRYKRPLSLVIVAVKGFTTLKEAFGPHEVERILARAAELIRGIVRDVDLPARFGDNEFAILLPESDEEAARIVARRISDALSAIPLPGAGTLSHVAVSSGVAALSPKVQSADELVRVALGALLAARRHGMGAVCSSADAVARRRELHENRQLIEQLGERLRALAEESQQGYFRSVLRALGEVPAMKRFLLPHSERVAFFAQRLAECCGIAGADPLLLHRAGLLHDAGKIAIDAELLSKAERLTAREEALMRRHPLFAEELIGSHPIVAEELRAVRHHHERFDGGGYPDGLAGEKIPLSARILAIAEAWDAMTSPQPYRREPLSLDVALEELRRGSGTQFDPALVDRFAALISG